MNSQFHQHLETCEQCRNGAFGQCVTGCILLLEDVTILADNSLRGQTPAENGVTNQLAEVTVERPGRA